MISIFSSALLVQTIFWIAFALGYHRARREGAALASEPASDSAVDSAGRPPSPVSIIVAARDEADTLPELIAALDAQTHAEFEVIIVDDASRDGTASVIDAATRSRPWLRRITIDDPAFPRKKRALVRAIEAARYDILAFTDADCRPRPGWLAEIVCLHDQSQKGSPAEDIVVVGHALFDVEQGWLNRFARFVSLITMVQAAATIGLGFPFMAFGTNLSYRKRMFEVVGGFGDGMRSLSGDDDLFVQHVARTGAARIVWLRSEDAVVSTGAKNTMRAWVHQKRRHASASAFFTPSIKTAGFLYWISVAGILVAAIDAVVAAVFTAFSTTISTAVSSPVFWVPASIVVVWMIVQTICIGKAFHHFKAQDLIPHLPVLAVLYLAFHAIMPVAGIFMPPEDWE